MRSVPRHWLFWPAVLFVIGLSSAMVWPGEPGQASWYSVVPPLVAVGLAMLTHRVLLSLGAAVLLGGLLMHTPSAPGSPSAWGEGIRQAGVFVTGSLVESSSEPAPGYEAPLADADDEPPPTVTTYAPNWWNINILLFVLFMLTAITVMIASGGLQGIINRFIRFAKTPRSTQVATAGAGLVVFIDDYANTMIVGNSMRPLSDKNRVSREKLAFLVDATSAPVAGLALLSTWIGYEVGLFGDVGRELQLGRDGYSMFLDALPYYSYCILMLFFVFVCPLSGKDFGPMLRAERRARREGSAPPPEEGAATPSQAAVPHPQARIFALSAVIPLATMILSMLAGLWLEGDGVNRLRQDSTALFSVTQWREALSLASDNGGLNRSLANAAALALILAVICALTLSRLPVDPVRRAIIAGLRGTLLPAAILVLAWSLKEVCSDDGLKTGDFLAEIVKGNIEPMWFPLLVFLLAGGTAFATGTSWGTMAILIPTAIPVAFHLDGSQYGLVTIISLAAILDGAIFGDHCSPISDTTVMSSTASGCDHIEHVRTQLPYALTVAGLALVCGYLPAVLGAPAWLGLLIGASAIVSLFVFLPPSTRVEEPS